MPDAVVTAFSVRSTGTAAAASCGERLIANNSTNAPGTSRRTPAFGSAGNGSSKAVRVTGGHTERFYRALDEEPGGLRRLTIGWCAVLSLPTGLSAGGGR
jgi:hypothetical protein